MKFQAGVSKFQFKVSFLTSNFPIRVSKLGARLIRFDYKVESGPSQVKQNIEIKDEILQTNLQNPKNFRTFKSSSNSNAAFFYQQ